MAGEFAVTMQLVFTRESWSHTMMPKKLLQNEEGSFHRENVNELLKGLIYFASVDNQDTRRHNLDFIINNGYPCWPDPRIIRKWDDRHVLMQECIKCGLTTDKVDVISVDGLKDVLPSLKYPFVLKTENSHQGEGKHLIGVDTTLPEWEGLATVEQFYSGFSTRVLTIGAEVFGLRYDNEESWIKNSAGAEVEPWDIPENVREHAARVHDHFGLEISGIDYVVEDNGEFHFLEYNMFPGIAAFDSTQNAARKIFSSAMDRVECER